MHLARGGEDRTSITLSLAFEDSAPDAVPEAELTVAGGGTVFGTTTLPMGDLGLPPDFDPSGTNEGEPEFAIARRRWPEIQKHLARANAGQTPLWLQLLPPVGNLAVLPWESMLAPVVGAVPIVRLPTFALFVPLELSRVDIVLCLFEPAAAGSPEASSLVRSLLDALPTDGSREFFVHVFASTTDCAEIGRAFFDRRVVLHDPRNATPIDSATNADRDSGPSSDGITNPWLLWIIDEMTEVTAEVIHFVARGSLTSGTHATLALPGSPIGKDHASSSGSVGPNELAECLARLGAWGVGFTSPPTGSPTMGIRQLSYDLERLRVGPVICHEAEKDPRGDQLALAYASLIEGRPPTFVSAVSLYAHPSTFDPRAAHDRELDPVAAVLAEMGQVGPASETEPPAWATSTRRYLEQAAARLLPEPSGEHSLVDAASAKAIGDVALFVDGILQEAEGERR